jgi:uncharacterized protein (TIGR02271 family)
MPTAEQVREWRGADLVDRDGDKIGTIEEIYLDTQSNQPEWALVNTGLFGTKSSFVPIRDATQEGDSLRVPVEKSQVKDAPKVDPDGQLSPQEESELYRHYGLDDGGAGTGDFGGDAEGDRGTVGQDVSGPTTDDAMTRSEEELRVGTTQRESGRARLRKYVETEEVEQTVPVQREEVRVEREPITDANRDAALDGPDISEEEHEVVLHEEEVVAEKQTVPKERISLEKDQVTDERQVSETLRKEQVDVDNGGRGDR